LRREFEMYGKIERIRIVKDKKGKSKSYAFIVYERERDMKGKFQSSPGLARAHVSSQPRTKTPKAFRYITRRSWWTSSGAGP
jgi:hypothetical protein